MVEPFSVAIEPTFILTVDTVSQYIVDAYNVLI